MKRVGIYIRVSTQEQAEKGWSVEGQYEEIRKYCDRQEGWKVVRVFRAVRGELHDERGRRPAQRLETLRNAPGEDLARGGLVGLLGVARVALAHNVDLLGAP